MDRTTPGDALPRVICFFREEVGPATRAALIEAAVDGLVAGLDSPALAELAGLYPDDPWPQLGEVADAIVRELDQPEPPRGAPAAYPRGAAAPAQHRRPPTWRSGAFCVAVSTRVRRGTLQVSSRPYELAKTI